MPLIRNRKTQFLACKLHIEMFICVCGLTHVSHELDVHVPDVFLPITYIRTHGRAVEKKFTCVMSGVYSIEHSTSGVHAKMPRYLYMFLNAVCWVCINFMCVLCIRNICLPCVMVIKRQIYVVSGHFVRQIVNIKNDLSVMHSRTCMKRSAVHITNVMSIVHIKTSTGLFPINHRLKVSSTNCFDTGYK